MVLVFLFSISDWVGVYPQFSTMLQVEICKDRIASALETLRPTNSWERTTAAGQGLDGVFLSGRGFGVAMEALFNYLSSEYGNTFALGMISYKDSIICSILLVM